VKEKSVVESILEELRHAHSHTRVDHAIKQLQKLLKERGAPIILGDEVYFFLKVENAHSIAIVGDWNEWDTAADKLERLNPSSDYYFIKKQFPITARFAYRFLINGEQSINDPLNHFVEQEVFGANTVVRMPGYSTPEYEESDSSIAEGRLRDIVISNDSKGNFGRMVKVYIPRNVRRYSNLPILYIHDGVEVRTVGKFITILDNLYHYEPYTKPCAFVFVPPAERNKEYMLNAAFARWFALTLVPEVEHALRIKAEATRRGVTGASLGGLLSAQLGYLFPKLFGHLAVQSPSFWVNNEQMIKLIKKVKPLNLRWYLHTGTVGDALTETRKMLTVLQEKNYEVTYRETQESHNWANWRGKYAEIVRWFIAGAE